MTTGGGIALLAVAGALVSLWVGALWIRPAVARARVQREVLLVQDRIWNAMHDGEIDRSSARGQYALLYCQFLIDRPKELNLTHALAFGTALKRSGAWEAEREATRKEIAELQSDRADGQTSIGNRILQEAEKQIDRTVMWYFFHGSTLWPILTPLYWLVQKGGSLDRIVDRETTIGHAFEQDSYELATEVRETNTLRHLRHKSRDWLAWDQGLDEPRWGIHTSGASFS